MTLSGPGAKRDQFPPQHACLSPAPLVRMGITCQEDCITKDYFHFFINLSMN